MSNYGYGSRKRYGDELSLRMYNVMIGLILLYGFVVNYVMCKYYTNVFAEWNYTLVIIGYFVVCILGMIISRVSKSAFLSFIGYNMVVLPVGVVLSIALKEVETDAIMNAIYVTGGVTAVMIILSFIAPSFFLSMGRVLGVGLGVAITVEIFCLIFGIVTHRIWDEIIAVLFAFYVAFDWAKAQEDEYTTDNAVDACVGLYLDIINLFLRVLSSSSKSSDD